MVCLQEFEMKFLKFNLVCIVLPCSMLCSLHLLGLSFFFSVISSKEFVLNVIYVYVKSVSNVQHVERDSRILINSVHIFFNVYLE
jgi:hypothetical protein